jgi:hypothetical protein
MSQTASSSPALDVSKSVPSESQMPDVNPDLNPAMPEDEGDFESVADRLMDHLFADVERMLDRGVDLLPESSQTALQPPLNSLDSTPTAAESQNLTLLPKLSPRPSLLDQAKTEEELSDLAALIAEVSEDKAPQNRSFDKLLLSLVMVALVATGGLWFYFRNRLTPSVAVVPPSATQIQQQKDQEFLDYVSRSLDRLERDAKAQRQTAAASPSPTASPSTVLERVYIPIYQSPAATSPALPTFPQTAPQTVTPQTGAPQTAAPQTVAPQTSSPTVPQTATPQTDSAAAPNIAASATHVLIGVLELGDRSAALFEVNGTPQRIQIGQSIGGSGWTLVSIKNQEAIVRRNGEVRSIYVGQQF